jgi:hypothetical protein
MKLISLFSIDFFPSFQNKDEYFQKITQEKDFTKRIINFCFLICFFSFIYGLVMGSYHSFMQAIAAGVKVPLLFSLAIVICFPAFYIIQLILGSKLKFQQMVSIILSGFVLSTAIMLSFTPIVIFFLLTGSNYYFLQLLHISIFILSGFFGMRTIIEALEYSCEKKNIYPKIGVLVFRFWIVIILFVGIQLAWNLRPFLGDTGKPFKLFREYEGNFYTALIYSISQLSKPSEKEKNSPQDTINKEQKADSLYLDFDKQY